MDLRYLGFAGRSYAATVSGEEGVSSPAGGISVIARSAIAVIVRLGFTPMFAGTAAPSQTSRFS